MGKIILNETPFEHLIRKLEEPSEPWEVCGERDTVYAEFTDKDWVDKDPVLQARNERSPL